ncbi:putative armadillo-like helical protein [Dioscorea sansibarensis]
MATASVKRSVKQLHFGGPDEKAAAAAEIKRIAGGDLRTRRSLAVLGVIPPLVSMILDSPGVSSGRKIAIEALLKLANGTFTNKALMVESGLIAKLPNIFNTLDSSTREELANLLLSISSLANTQHSIQPHEILPFLIKILSDRDTEDEIQVKFLATLQNLSTKIETTKLIVSSGLVHALLSFSIKKRTSKEALATLSNLVLTSVGKKAIENDTMVPEIFIEILAWEGMPQSQELAAYILMVIAHQSAKLRKQMITLGIVPLLLEVALLGSPLAQKRSLKMLQWFKDERQAKLGAHSGPQSEIFGISNALRFKGERSEECERDVRKMVKQSLDQNLKLIMRRGDVSDGCSRIKSLVFNSSSKSLPY